MEVNSGLRIPFLSTLLKNVGMRIDEIHRARLKMLVKRQGGGRQSTLSQKIGKSPAQISQWINASKDSTSGKPRAMDRKTAREIEAALGLADGWMDQPLSEAELSGVSPPSDIAIPSGTESAHSVTDSGAGQGGESTASLIPPSAAVFTPTNLSAAVHLVAKLLESMDVRSRKTFGGWMMELAVAKDLSEEAADIADKAEGLATRQRISKNAAINRAFSGRGQATETEPANL